MLRAFIALCLVFGINGSLLAIDAVYEGTNGIREKVLTVCLQCHSSTLSAGARNNAPSPPNFDTYAEAIILADSAVGRAVDRSMPPSGVPGLNAEQRAAMLAWQAAGFPEKAAAAPDTQTPSAPSGFTATANGVSKIDLAWSAASDNVGVTAYKLYRGGTLIATLASAVSHADTGLSPGTAYTYTITACDAAGNCSAQGSAGSTVTATTLQQSDCLFNWAETSFPGYFTPPTQSQSAPPDYGRLYPPGTILAIAASRLLYFGPLSPAAILDLGDVASWYPQAGCN